MSNTLNYKSKKEIRTILVLFGMLCAFSFGVCMAYIQLLTYIQYTNTGIVNPDSSGIATVLLFLSMGVILGITLTMRND